VSSMTPSNTAVIVVDMQNDFVRVGAALEVVESRATLGAHQRLLGAARRLGLPVVYTKFIAGPDRTLVWDVDPMIADPIRFAWKGHMRYYPDIDAERDVTDIVDEIYPATGDHIVEKFGFDAFYNTNLEDFLRANHVEHLIITGTVTNICVDSTGRGAFHRQFRSVFVSDAVSSPDPEQHRVTLKNLGQWFGRVLATDEVVAELEAVRELVGAAESPR